MYKIPRQSCQRAKCPSPSTHIDRAPSFSSHFKSATMRFQSLVVTSLLPLAALADINNPPALGLTNVTFSSYYTFVSPSAAGPKLGSISFAIVNDAMEGLVACSGYSTNSWAMFYPSTEMPCDSPEPSEEAECMTSSASFNLDTMTPGEMNLTVQLSWSCTG